MTARRDPRDYLLHIRDALSGRADYTKGGREAFLASAMIRDAVVRNLEVTPSASSPITRWRMASTTAPAMA
jgi:uncharacterized protein with HEPN domain